MKHKEDVGLTYIKRIGLKTERDNKSVYNSIVYEYGKAKADEIASLLDVAEKMDTMSIFPTAEENLKLLKIYTGGIEANKIRTIANYIDNNVGMIGNKILVLGAGNGLLLPFLSDKFSQEKITVFTSNAQKRTIYEALLKEQNCENIDFTDTALSDMEEASFDALILLDSFYPAEETELFDGTFQMLSGQVEAYEKCYQLVVEQVKRVLKPFGFLIAAETAEPSPKTLALLYALNKAVVGPVVSTLKSIDCKLLDTDITLQCFACQKGSQADKVDIDNLWSESLGIDSNDNEFTEAQAELMLENFHAELIDGCFLVNDKFEKQAKFAMYECRQNSDLLLYYFNMFDSSYLGFYSKQIQDQITEDMNERISTFEKTGCTKKKFTLVGNQELMKIEKGDLIKHE